MRKIRFILIPVLICFLTGAIAAWFQSDALATWYPYLKKSPLNPPNMVFPIAWSILYVLMGLSIGLIAQTNSPRRRFFIELFSAQLFFNFAWSIVFFYFQKPLLGLVVIIILEFLIICYFIKAYPEFRVSAWLFVPYILWVGFATYLNAYIVLNN